MITLIGSNPSSLPEDGPHNLTASKFVVLMTALATTEQPEKFFALYPGFSNRGLAITLHND